MKKVLSLLMSFVMFISITAGLNISANANDYASNSNELSLNGQWSGNYWITETNRENWYRITIPSDGYLELRLRSYFNTRLALYNYDLSKIIFKCAELQALNGSENSPVTATKEIALSTGTYYAEVTGDNTGKYNLYASYESYGVNDFEANSFDSPQDLPQNYEIVGALTATDKEDWFKIYVPADKYYTFKLTSYHHYTDLYLYNYDLSKLIIRGSNFGASGSEISPETKIKNIVLSSGTYYIKISGDGGGKYLFSWYELTPENCKHEFKNETVQPTCKTKGYTIYKCNICGFTYTDNYVDVKSHDYGSNLKYCRVCGAKNPAYARPKGTKIKKISGTKKSIAVSWSKVSGIYGYQVQVATDKKFKNNKKTVTISTQNATKTTVKKLKAKKKYYIRVRTYKVVNGQRIYSSWTSAKTAKTK